MWFERLVGFKEKSPEQVRSNISMDGTILTSKVNGKSYEAGVLEVSSLAELRQQAPSPTAFSDHLNLREHVGDVQQLHLDPSNENALFQAASQFNLLEMVGPGVRPENGVDIYENDHTQGPACAIACGAGTIYRNYFVKVNGQEGQSVDYQIDCLAEIGAQLGNQGNRLWKMTNGYALPTEGGLSRINAQLGEYDAAQREALKSELKVGIQRQTQVTLGAARHKVTQVYCSALPVAYTHYGRAEWEPFARLVLEATYEATLYAALLNREKTGCEKVYLTLVGGGAFGNAMPWIMDALSQALWKFRHSPLDVAVVSYGRSDSHVRQLLADWG